MVSLLVMTLLNCCTSATAPDSPIPPLFEVIPPETSGLVFVNRLRESPTQNVLTYEYFYNGAGVAVGDFNGDELPDIYLVSNLEANALYLNKGEFVFQNVSTISQAEGGRGFATGVSVVDINADGLLDIYICKSGRFTQADLRQNELLINQGNNADGIPVFTEQSEQYGLNIAAYSTQASFFDYDGDGDLDAFLINHGIDTYDTDEISLLQQQHNPLQGEMLLRNDEGTFVDVTEAAGIIRNELGYGLGLGVADLNDDQFPDIYVSNDYSGKDHLYINQQDGTFRECIQELTSQISFYAMGNDIADINNDGWPDIVNLDMVAADNYGIKTSMSAMNPAQFYQLVEQGEHYQYMFNSLLLSNGVSGEQVAPNFSNIAQLAGISSTDWSWGPLLFDMDNDGWQDLFITNGIKRNIRNTDATQRVVELQKLLASSKDEQERALLMQQMLQQFPYHRKANYFFHNDGHLTYTDITATLQLDTLLTASHGAAYADFDLDGDLDLIVNNVDQSASLLRNNATDLTPHHSLVVSLEGPPKNPFGIGATVTIQQDSFIQRKELYTSRGYQSAVAPVLYFGWSKSSPPSHLQVTWPDGKYQRIENVKPGKLTLQYADATANNNASVKQEPLFNTTKNAETLYTHQENKFDDFQRELLLPHKMSNQGPAAAIGDVDNNGWPDVFIGGAAGQSAALLLQQENGDLIPSNDGLWENTKMYEDTEAVFFDFDQDQDLDLLIGSGSNEWPLNDTRYRLRLYQNEGQGIFTDISHRLPSINVSVGALAVGDFNADGRDDLFIGGRQVPGNYPRAADSYLLTNQSTQTEVQFIDQTNVLAPFLKDYGMVTAATWQDINGDQQLDLVTVGEWMSPKILLNQGGGTLKDGTQAARLEEEVGWWYSLAIADIDADGDLDLVVGNLGLNYKYQASKQDPFEVFSTDFDNNGSQDIVLGYHNNDRLFPLRGRACSSEQMPFIKNKFPTYHAFAKATIEEVYDESQLASSVHYSATNFAHCYFENDGQGHFTLHRLPTSVQLSSVNAILIDDFDNDTKLDILCAGNLYEAEVETPRNDASYGHLLTNVGRGEFRLVPASRTGLQIKGEVRALLPLSTANSLQNRLLVVKNNASVEILQWP